MKKPFTYTEGKQLMAWYAIFIDAFIEEPLFPKIKHEELQNKVKALVEGFTTSTYEWTGEEWRTK